MTTVLGEIDQYRQRLAQIQHIAIQYKTENYTFDPDKLGPMLVTIGEAFGALQAIEIIARVTLEATQPAP